MADKNKTCLDWIVSAIDSFIIINKHSLEVMQLSFRLLLKSLPTFMLFHIFIFTFREAWGKFQQLKCEEAQGHSIIHIKPKQLKTRSMKYELNFPSGDSSSR